MTLPNAFKNSEEYFEECLLFFKQYEHLYKYANTDILIYKILEEIKVGDLENVDTFREDFTLSSLIGQHYYLRQIFAQLKRFEVANVFTADVGVNEIMSKKLNVSLKPKKKYEIMCLAKEIENACEQAHCDTVVDFGSGLGYLDQLLFDLNKYKVLGLECNEKHYVSAKKRQNAYYSDSRTNVKYVRHTVTETSDENIEKYLKEKFSTTNGFCIAGLHACADLTIDAINIFLKMANARSLMIMPCCYHRMKKDINGKFFNFPLSNTLKHIYDKHDGSEFLKEPFLRLALQPTSKDEDNLKDLVFYLLARAVLQLYAHERNCKLKRNKRKAVKAKTMNRDFEEYLEDASSTGFTLTQATDGAHLYFEFEKVCSIWRDISSTTRQKAALFILLQNLLQPVFENFILHDRLTYLREKGIQKCEIKKILDEQISPRCFALLAYK